MRLVNSWRSKFNLRLLMWVSLLFALGGSLKHVAWSFSTLEGMDIVSGYLQAIAVDLGMLSLAVGIAHRRRMNRKTLAVWIGASGFALISVYANLLHGAAFQSPVHAPGWELLLPLRPVLLSAVLPLLALYLTEVVGDDENYIMVTNEEAGRVQDRIDALQAENKSLYAQIQAQAQMINEAPARKVLPKADLIAGMLEVWKTRPDITNRELAETLGVDPARTSTVTRELVEQGTIHKNGKVVVV